jgi:CRP-like cAMP-binding protein
MPTERIIEFLSGITLLSDRFVKETMADLKQENYKSHQIIQAKDQPETRIWFLKSGFARSYFYDEKGNEHTTRFWQENEIIFSFSGVWNLPAMEYVEILVDAELNPISYQQLYEFINKFPEINILIKFVIKRALQQKYTRHALCSLQAEKRYRQLRRDSPEVFKNAPLRIIASYLNMTRESLSRIISKKNI